MRIRGGYHLGSRAEQTKDMQMTVNMFKTIDKNHTKGGEARKLLVDDFVHVQKKTGFST